MILTHKKWLVSCSPHCGLWMVLAHRKGLDSVLPLAHAWHRFTGSGSLLILLPMVRVWRWVTGSAWLLVLLPEACNIWKYLKSLCKSSFHHYNELPKIKGGKICFGFQFCMFYSMTSLLPCFRPVAKMHIMAGICHGTNLLNSWLRSRKKEEGDRILEFLFWAHPKWSKTSHSFCHLTTALSWGTAFYHKGVWGTLEVYILTEQDFQVCLNCSPTSRTGLVRMGCIYWREMVLKHW